LRRAREIAITRRSGGELVGGPDPGVYKFYTFVDR